MPNAANENARAVFRARVPCRLRVRLRSQHGKSSARISAGGGLSRRYDATGAGCLWVGVYALPVILRRFFCSLVSGSVYHSKDT
jgi:hypothetical protein